jgi:hypothetical protein
VRHADLDVLKLSALSDTPPEGDEGGVPGQVGGVEDDVFETDGEGQLARDSGCWVLAGKQNPVVWEARGRLEDGGL